MRSTSPKAQQEYSQACQNMLESTRASAPTVCGGAQTRPPLTVFYLSPIGVDLGEIYHMYQLVHL